MITPGPAGASVGEDVVVSPSIMITPGPAGASVGEDVEVSPSIIRIDSFLVYIILNIMFLQKYHIDRNANLLSSRRHRSSLTFADLLMWGRDRMSQNFCSTHCKLLYNSSPNCKPPGLVTMLNMLGHIYSYYNVSKFVAHM